MPALRFPAPPPSAGGRWRLRPVARHRMTDDDFGKPIVAIANSFTQFVPGHVHL